MAADICNRNGTSFGNGEADKEKLNRATVRAGANAISTNVGQQQSLLISEISDKYDERFDDTEYYTV